MIYSDKRISVCLIKKQFLFLPINIKMQSIFKKTFLSVLFLFTLSCSRNRQNEEMQQLLLDAKKYAALKNDTFDPVANLALFRNQLSESETFEDSLTNQIHIGETLLLCGDEDKAIETFNNILNNKLLNSDYVVYVKKDLALSWLRSAEQLNCVNNHGTQSCVFPIKGDGIHQNKNPSRQAISIYESILKEKPDDLEARWLLNTAYMTIGGYPDRVPPNYLIKSLDEKTNLIKPFVDVAPSNGLNINNQSGGSIIDDFNNDGYPDIVTSSWSLSEGMHFNINNGDGSFTDISESSGLRGFTGGLNIMQTDYNNDGFKDIFVLRGAWKREFGKEPNSLLRNNGDNTFTDVTEESGLLSFHPTQTATWADFNNDGWLDVFIGNESVNKADGNLPELFLSNRNGT
ncbi:MAG: hypothetical protein JWQ25_333, partial [Daejeonella sp.]|nr:hypothetical protein [Daejeonella sp.]